MSDPGVEADAGPEPTFWGTGAAATQCEGAAPRSDWAGWEADGFVPPSGDGNGFRTRFADDLALWAEHGLGTVHVHEVAGIGKQGHGAAAGLQLVNIPAE